MRSASFVNKKMKNFTYHIFPVKNLPVTLHSQCRTVRHCVRTCVAIMLGHLHHLHTEYLQLIIENDILEWLQQGQASTGQWTSITDIYVMKPKPFNVQINQFNYKLNLSLSDLNLIKN